VSGRRDALSRPVLDQYFAHDHIVLTLDPAMAAPLFALWPGNDSDHLAKIGGDRKRVRAFRDPSGEHSVTASDEAEAVFADRAV